MMDESCDLLADFSSILNRQKNCFYRLVNIPNIICVRWIEVHTVESLVPGLIHPEVEIAIVCSKSINC
jgi:hypothetical protein